MNVLKTLSLTPSRTSLFVHHRNGALLSSLVWALVAGGVIIRLFHFIDNRSLWIDEIYLITSILKMDFTGLAAPELDYQQKAPIGFLWLVKGSVLLFGQGEMALRLVPLLCGIASLFAFLPVARYFLKPLGVLIAMGILALAPPLVYHSVEVKQYGMELLVSILALQLYTCYHGKKARNSLLRWGLWGAVLLWFSFSSIFILAGLAIGTSVYYLFTKKWRKFGAYLLPFCIWFISFAINFLLFTHQHTEQAWLVSWFRERGGFAPIPFFSPEGGLWLLKAFYRTLDYPLGLLWNANALKSFTNTPIEIFVKMGLVWFFFWGIGLVLFYRKSKKVFLALVFPLLLTLTATLLDLYPYMERMIVFLAPLPILFIARGCEHCTSAIPARFRWRYALPALLLFWPLWGSANHLLKPQHFGSYKYSSYRDALLYINEHYRQGDLVLVYWNIEHAYDYYQKAYGLEYEALRMPDIKNSLKSKAEYLQQLQPYFEKSAASRRTWFIHERFLKLNIGDFDYQPPWYHRLDVEAGAVVKGVLDQTSHEADRYVGSNVQVILYERAEPEQPQP